MAPLAAVPALGGWKECWHAPRGRGPGGGCHQCPHCPLAFCFYCNDMLEEREEGKKKTRVGVGRGGQKRKREQGPWCGLMSGPGRMCRQLGSRVDGARLGCLGGWGGGGARDHSASHPSLCRLAPGPPPSSSPPGADVGLCQSGAGARVWGLHPDVSQPGWATQGRPLWVSVSEVCKLGRLGEKGHSLPCPGSALQSLEQSEDSHWDRGPSTAPERQSARLARWLHLPSTPGAHNRGGGEGGGAWAGLGGALAPPGWAAPLPLQWQDSALVVLAAGLGLGAGVVVWGWGIA